MHEESQTVLDRIMEKHGLKNHDLVAVSTLGLTHKQVQKGRRGKILTPRIQRKIAAALSSHLNETWTPDQLFPSSFR